ncbi:MAG: hypothetical protein DHS20C14_03490 [Phycisphaeraceae bacterium]|nr:MAG: hypothetical protein DHS20C14_03490 [Phycisphaeraceae bacterium]
MHSEPPTLATAPAGKKPLRLKLPISLIVIGLLLGVGGIIGFALPLMSAMSGGESFEAPGTHVLHVTEPGPWAIYYETTAMSGGAITFSSAPPNATVAVTNGGQPVPVASNTSMTMTVGSSERHSLATFDADTPGEYQIDVAGGFSPRTFHVMPDKLMGAIFGAFGGCGAGVAGVGLVLAGVLVLIVRAANR